MSWSGSVCLTLLPTTEGEAAAGAAHRPVGLTEALQAEGLKIFHLNENILLLYKTNLVGLIVGAQHGGLVLQDLLQGGDVSGGHQTAAHSRQGCEAEGRALWLCWRCHSTAHCSLLSLTAHYSLLTTLTIVSFINRKLSDNHRHRQEVNY